MKLRCLWRCFTRGIEIPIDLSSGHPNHKSSLKFWTARTHCGARTKLRNLLGLRLVIHRLQWHWRLADLVSCQKYLAEITPHSLIAPPAFRLSRANMWRRIIKRLCLIPISWQSVVVFDSCRSVIFLPLSTSTVRNAILLFGSYTAQSSSSIRSFSARGTIFGAAGARCSSVSARRSSQEPPLGYYKESTVVPSYVRLTDHSVDHSRPHRRIALDRHLLTLVYREEKLRTYWIWGRGKFTHRNFLSYLQYF